LRAGIARVDDSLKPMTDENENDGWDRGTIILLAHILVIVFVVGYLIKH
jgi:hypothetical protein